MHNRLKNAAAEVKYSILQAFFFFSPYSGPVHFCSLSTSSTLVFSPFNVFHCLLLWLLVLLCSGLLFLSLEFSGIIIRNRRVVPSFFKMLQKKHCSANTGRILILKNPLAKVTFRQLANIKRSHTSMPWNLFFFLPAVSEMSTIYQWPHLNRHTHILSSFFVGIAKMKTLFPVSWVVLQPVAILFKNSSQTSTELKILEIEAHF